MRYGCAARQLDPPESRERQRGPIRGKELRSDPAVARKPIDADFLRVLAFLRTMPLRRILVALLCTAYLAGLPVAGGAAPADSLCGQVAVEQPADPGCCGGGDTVGTEACPVACPAGSAACVLSDAHGPQTPSPAAPHFPVSATRFAVHAIEPDTAPPKTFVA